MSNIEFKDLTFGYGATLIFDHAQINIDDSWKLGLVGRNGRGKSTLLKLLQGKITTDSPISTNKNFVYFPQLSSSDHQMNEEVNHVTASSQRSLTNASALTFYLLSELADFEQWELERELTLLKVDLEVLWRPYETLSGGEQTKCLLALLFLDESNFPLIDEPTNHLDMASRETVAHYLKKKSGFIVVSHDRHFLDEVCDHTLAIERRQIKLYQGNFSTYEHEKKLRDDQELSQDGKLKKEITRLKQTAREKEEWSKTREKTKDQAADSGFVSARAARMMKKSKHLEKRMSQDLTEKEALLQNIEKVEPLVMNNLGTHHKRLLHFEHFQLAYEGQPLFEPVTFSLMAGQITALLGANGSGKSTLLKFIENDFTGEHKGYFESPQGLKISYVRQIYENKGDLKSFALMNQLDMESFLANLRKLGMERSVFELEIEQMSQGQQKKVELARSLSQEAHLYIWDEPLNYLDVFNQGQIIQLLKIAQPTLLLVEHDQSFIEAVANQTVELTRVK